MLALLDDTPFREQRLLLDNLPQDHLDAWAPDCGAFCLLSAAIGHHGRPVEISAARHQSTYWESFQGRDPFAGIGNLTQHIRHWFPDAFATTAASLPANPVFQHAFAGLVMLADWLGSDTRFFPYSPSRCDRMDFARQQAATALREFWIEPSLPRTGMGTQLPEFSTVSPFEPRRIQSEILSLPRTEAPSLVLLESETGSGKTEAALARFVRLFHAGEVDGIYFALPTRTAATQLHRRVCESVKRMFPSESLRPPVVLAVPGYLQVDGHTGTALPGFNVLWNDDPTERFRYRGWAAEQPKRFLAGSVVIGTIDQVLLSTLMVSHAHMRATSLLRLLLVVDEVHASDSYMSQLTECVLENHLGAGGHAFLMSATLGSAARRRFFPPYDSSPPAGIEEEEKVPYPLITHRLANAGGRRIVVPSEGMVKNVKIGIQPWTNDPESIARSAVAAASGGARVLILRNTVGGCLATQEVVERTALTAGRNDLLFSCRDQHAPHHARFSKADRELLDVCLESRFGARGPSGGCIVVATQTVQQSLDLDFDILFTDLCPMDVLLQRIGRVHRHVRERPMGFYTPHATVLVPAERDLTARISPKDGSVRGDHGIGTVYEDMRVIEATWRCLEQFPTLSLPPMNRMLVERSTHRDILDGIATEKGEAWARHGSWIRGGETAQKQVARLNVIDRRQDFGEGHVGFPSDELERRIRTRLGEDDRLVHFEPPALSPFGSEVRDLTIPAHLSRGVPMDAEASDFGQSSASFAFRFGSRHFIYDRTGLQLKAREEQEMETTDA